MDKLQIEPRKHSMDSYTDQTQFQLAPLRQQSASDNHSAKAPYSSIDEITNRFSGSPLLNIKMHPNMPSNVIINDAEVTDFNDLQMM